jgi:exodeoxyribonuclease VII large subunit
MITDGRMVYSVTEINTELRSVLEDTYPQIWLEGEIYGLKIYPSGHAYFSLKDENSTISAICFSASLKALKFALEDGQKVIANGKISLYTKTGKYQFLAFYIEPSGVGAQAIALEQLKKKLEKEGLFKESNKKKLPEFPKTIAIVTSIAGAALHDMLSVINRRFAGLEILIYPVKVQGKNAKNEIALALENINKHLPQTDVILLGRGGGDKEDLWAFNEEVVARAISSSKIPIISCVGHETDFTIADFVADVRAPTPSAAAELVVRNSTEVIEKFVSLKNRISFALSNKIENLTYRLEAVNNCRYFKNPEELIFDFQQRTDELSSRVEYLSKNIYESKTVGFSSLIDKLNILSPLSVLKRGYAFCTKENSGEAINNAISLALGDKVKVRLSNGNFISEVKEIEV